jgi:hypothetical protein
MAFEDKKRHRRHISRDLLAISHIWRSDAETPALLNLLECLVKTPDPNAACF